MLLEIINIIKSILKYIVTFMIIAFFVFIVYRIDSKNIKVEEQKNDFYKLLLSFNNHFIPAKINKRDFLKSSLSYLSEKYVTYSVISGNTFPVMFSKDNLALHVNDLDYDFKKLQGKSNYVSDPNLKEVLEPLVYIYNTHQLEEYSNKYFENFNITPTVMTASFMLKEKLEKLGIPAIVETGNFTEILNLNQWPYSKSYTVSRMFIIDAMHKYPSLKYFIDVHRDAITKEQGTVTINGRNYARILFLVGLVNSKNKGNEKLVKKMNDYINKHYPGLSRGILTRNFKETPTNLAYNQDLHENLILIEFGGSKNHIDEVFASVEVIAEVLAKIIKEGG